MRDIKFRAWDSHINGMVSNDCLAVVAGEPAYIMEQNEGSLVSSFRQDMILMQFTGLLDKNGVDIYEGDICEFDSHDLIDRFVIKCEEWVEFYPDYIGEPLCEDRTRDFYRIEDSKVIGNIYENAELLE